VSPYWVLPVYLGRFGQFGQMMGTGHYYFDEMRSSFNLVQNQLFGAHETQYLQNNVQNLSNHGSSSAEKRNIQ
jgi:hypothetical protein